MVGEHANWMPFIFSSLAPNLTVTLTPSVINGSAVNVDINLTCTAIVEEYITSDEYQFVWIFNGTPVDQSDGRIDVRLYCVFVHKHTTKCKHSKSYHK